MPNAPSSNSSNEPGLISDLPNPKFRTSNPRSDNTVTLLTPLGQGGLAAVRLFGPGLAAILDRVFVPRNPAADVRSPDRLRLGRVIDPANGEQIDEGMLRGLPGELGAELTLHGGVRIVQRVVAACQSRGARRLDPGRPDDRDELWRQSLLLARAGGVSRPALWADIEMALPRARTRAAAEWLVGQWGGGLGGRIASLIAETLNGKPGPPNDNSDAVDYAVESLNVKRDATRDALERLLGEYPGWVRAIAGVRVAIVGPANAGKSTLLNTLAGADAAIVSDLPGTTRDYVARWVNLDGQAVELIDTAGGHEEAGELESRAADLAAPVVRSADLRLVLLDGSRPPSPADLAQANSFLAIQPALAALNKSDLAPGWDATADLDEKSIVRISAKSAAGLAELSIALRTRLGLPDLTSASAGAFADRQVELIRQVLAARDSSHLSDILTQMLDG